MADWRWHIFAAYKSIKEVFNSRGGIGLAEVLVSTDPDAFMLRTGACCQSHWDALPHLS